MLCTRCERVRLASRQRQPSRDPPRPRGGQRQFCRVEPEERGHVRVMFGRSHDPDMGGTSGCVGGGWRRGTRGADDEWQGEGQDQTAVGRG